VQQVVRRIDKELKAAPIDIAFVGIGENGHLAFLQVPRTAIGMSVRQILKVKEIIAVVPDARKAPAVSETAPRCDHSSSGR
jgi:glucosamine-6-phosphate deaminase